MNVLLGLPLRYHQQLWPRQKTEWDGNADKRGGGGDDEDGDGDGVGDYDVDDGGDANDDVDNGDEDINFNISTPFINNASKITASSL